MTNGLLEMWMVLVLGCLVSLTCSKVELELEQLARLGIDTDQLLEQLRNVASSNYGCGVHEHHHMTRTWLRNDSVTCNDGSPAGYYIRTSHGSKRWIVFLEGGWFCFDRNSCRGRWLNTPHLMTSGHWPDRRTGTGILSADPTENPHLFNANMVYIPYCSSDSWSGTHRSAGKGEFSFMGAQIVEEVIKDLWQDHSLNNAEKLYLAGTSAGGTGVLLNLDHVAGVLAQVAPHVEVRGIADSGWFLDNEQYKKASCSDAHSCSPTESIQQGFHLWHGRVPEACRKDYEHKDHWRCYFGYRIYPTLKTPVFVIQHLFDEAQITADNVGPPVGKEQWQYIHNVGQDMKRTLMNVSAVFAPACLSHIILTRREWQRLSIGGVTLPQALQCWESSTHETNHYISTKKFRKGAQLVQQLITGESPPRRGRDRYLSDDPQSERERQQKRRKRRRKHKDKDRDTDETEIVTETPSGATLEGNSTEPVSTEELRRMRKRERRRQKKLEKRRRREELKERRRNEREGRRRDRQEQVQAAKAVLTTRRRRSLILFDEHDIHHMRHHDNQCNHHRLDHCAWPQCNLHCPKIHNPFTGEEMDFIDLLLQFGLDLSSIANALGMDVPTLQTMDHSTLLKLLTQYK